MSKALNKLRKLKGRSFTEFRVRGAQAIAAAAERYGLSPQARVPSDAALFRSLRCATGPPGNGGWKQFGADQLLEQFRRRASPNFFASFTVREETLAELRGRFGDGDRALVIERAKRICEGKFDLLGLRGLSFGEPVNWHLEPISGKQTPLLHWSRIKYLDAAVAGDKKISWELNRHHYFMTLGRAYWHTGDELFAQTFVAHLNAWMDANPPKLGINWASSLEVAFRAISWLWAIHFFKDAPCMTPEVFQRALKFLFLHARHLETYLSTYFSPNTHLTGEALGLYYLGTLLPEFRVAARWRAAGRRILLAQLERHVRPDGVYFEQSSYYHRYTTDFYLHFRLLAQANGEDVGGLLEEKLQSLLDHLMYITRPDGRTPVFGDDDGGRLVMLDERAANDFRATLSTGAALFGRADYKYVSGEAAEETLWLLGGAALRKFDDLAAHPPATLSRAFPDGGYYVMRDGWSAADNYLLIDCGPHGADNCGHAHADALAFELATGGRAVLVDPGTYTYTGSTAARSVFRGSLAHNTLSIDGESSSVPDGAFTWEHIARATTRRWLAHERFDFFAGQHDGYERLPSPATHVREVLFIKGEYWMLRDIITTAGAHRYQWRYHFAPHAVPFVRAGRQQRLEGGSDISSAVAKHELEISLPGEEAEVNQEEGWVSECYGARTSAPVIVLSTTGEGPQDFMTFLIPRGKNQTGSVEWREIAASGGRAFAAFVKDGRDLVMVGDGRRIEAAPFSSDFAWMWARMGDELVPEELILIDGGYLSLDGREVIKSGQPIGYLVARRVGDEWLVETDASDMLVFTPPAVAGRIVINCAPGTGREGQLVKH